MLHSSHAGVILSREPRLTIMPDLKIQLPNYERLPIISFVTDERLTAPIGRVW